MIISQLLIIFSNKKQQDWAIYNPNQELFNHPLHTHTQSLDSNIELELLKLEKI